MCVNIYQNLFLISIGITIPMINDEITKTQSRFEKRNMV